MVIALTGNGQTGKGFLNILETMKIKPLTVDELEAFWASDEKGLRWVQLDPSHMMSNGKPFDK